MKYLIIITTLCTICTNAAYAGDFCKERVVMRCDSPSGINDCHPVVVCE